MAHSNFLDDVFKFLGLNDFSTSFDRILNSIDELKENENDKVMKYHTTYVRNDLKTVKEQSEYVKKKMELWSFISTCVSEPVDCQITFELGGKKTLVFTWDNEMKLFFTEQKEGEENIKMYYDPTKNILTSDPDCDESREKEETENKDVCSCENHQDCKKDVDVKETEEFTNDDKNLAFNLKNKLTKKIEESKEKVVLYVCPNHMIDDFKSEVIEKELYETEYYDDEPYEIKWKLSNIIEPSCIEMADWTTIVNDVYKNEADKLDIFCEKLKEVYGFSMASWSTVGDPFEDIEFRAVF